MNRQTKDRNNGVELVPVEYDAQGRARRYEVVRAEPEQLPTVIDDGQPLISPIPAQPARVTSHLEGDFVNRARAFSIKTWQLSLITGGGMVIGAVALAGQALPLLTLLAYFFGGFLAIWLAAFITDVLVSAEGSEFLNTVFLWRYLRHEQRERHRRYGAPQPRRERWIEIGDRLFVLFIVAWVLLGGVAWLIVRGA